MKCLLVATSFILVAPVFADVKQDLLGTCIDNYLAGDFDSVLSSCIKPAAHGGADAQFLLGKMHFKGEGTPQDYKQAIYWFTKAAEQGNSGAQSQLGVIFYSGKGTPKDNVMAYVWWNIAAAQGNESAANNRGIIEKDMTPNQIAEAQKLSKEYYAKYDK
jgi:TPR repeat protein